MATDQKQQKSLKRWHYVNIQAHYVTRIRDTRKQPQLEERSTSGVQFQKCPTSWDISLMATAGTQLTQVTTGKIHLSEKCYFIFPAYRNVRTDMFLVLCYKEIWLSPKIREAYCSLEICHNADDAATAWTSSVSSQSKMPQQGSFSTWDVVTTSPTR